MKESEMEKFKLCGRIKGSLELVNIILKDNEHWAQFFKNEIKTIDRLIEIMINENN